MSGFFQNLLNSEVSKAAGYIFGSEYLRDFTHASKTFRPNAYQYAPKYKFLFHVYFDINSLVYSKGLSDGVNYGLGVKSVKLPNYTFETHTMNQYNRKRIVQTKLRYDPIDITFHDDNGNSIRNMWYNYYTYYYKDAAKPVYNAAGKQTRPAGPTNAGSVAFNHRNLYDDKISNDVDWGYIGESNLSVNNELTSDMGQTKIPFFRAINIFGFNQWKNNFSIFNAF